MTSQGRNQVSCVTPRPRVGRPYPSPTISNDPDSNRAEWARMNYPGGKQLWCRLVVGFTIVTLVGAVFVIIGAVFFAESYRIYEEKGISIAMTWCIIGIVCGTLLMGSGIVIGRLIISDKWRTNEQPSYTRRRNRVRATPRSEESRDAESNSEVLSTSPPPYPRDMEDSGPPPTAVFIINGGRVNFAMPVISINAPPRYTAAVTGDITQRPEDTSGAPNIPETGVPKPPQYSEDDPCKLPVYNEDKDEAKNGD